MNYLFITNGSNVENSTIGGQDKPCEYIPTPRPGGSFDLWRKIAAQDSSFGHPEKFYGDPEECKWMGVTVNTLDEKILPYIKNICKRDPLSGKVVTRRNCYRSRLRMAFELDYQPPASVPLPAQGSVPGVALWSLPQCEGDFVKKPMKDCTGKEICMEWLYHIGVPENQIEIWPPTVQILCRL